MDRAVLITPKSPVAPLRAVLLGNGDSAQYLMLPAAASIKEVSIEAICARDRPRLLETAERWGIGAVFEDWSRALDAIEPDLVIVALPPSLQPDAVASAVSRGAHVLLEKPAAVCEAAALRLAQLARNSHLHLTVNLPLRFHPAFECLAAVLRAELASTRPAKVCFRYIVSPPRQAWYHDRAESGGAPLAIGIHPVDFLVETLPERPTRLQVRRVTDEIAEFKFFRGDLLLAEGMAGWSDSAPGIEFAVQDRDIAFRFGPGDSWSLSRPGSATKHGSAFGGFAEHSSLHDIVRRILSGPTATTNDLRQHIELLLPLVSATCDLRQEWRDVDVPIRRSANG